MSEVADNLVLAMLRKINTELSAMHDILVDMRGQFASAEVQVADVRRDIAAARGEMVRLADRFDALDKRLARIEGWVCANCEPPAIAP